MEQEKYQEGKVQLAIHFTHRSHALTVLQEQAQMFTDAYRKWSHDYVSGDDLVGSQVYDVNGQVEIQNTTTGEKEIYDTAFTVKMAEITNIQTMSLKPVAKIPKIEI